MPLLNDDTLAQLGLLTVTQSTKREFTDKPNTNLVFGRLINQEKAFYSSKVQIDIYEYKTIVLSDWSFAVELNQEKQRIDLAFWQEWIEFGRKLYVYFDHQLIKINSKEILWHYLLNMRTAPSYRAIQHALSEHNIAADKAIIVDHFKRQQIIGAIECCQSNTPLPRSLKDVHHINLALLLEQKDIDINALLSSLEHGEGNFNFVLNKELSNQANLNEKSTQLIEQLLKADFFSNICIDAQTLKVINRYIEQHKPSFKITHIDMTEIDIYSPDVVPLFNACPKLKALSYTPPPSANPIQQNIAEIVLKRLQNLNALHLFLTHCSDDNDTQKIRCFEHCEHLETLEFNVKTKVSLFPNFLKVNQLKNLLLTGINLDEYINLFQCPKLTHLELDDVQFIFENGFDFPLLKTLYLKNMEAVSCNFALLALPQLGGLEHLFIDQCNSCLDHDFSMLEPQPKSLNLKSLSISGGEMSEISNYLVFSSCHSLISLCLSFCVKGELATQLNHHEAFLRLKYLSLIQYERSSFFQDEDDNLDEYESPSGEDIATFLSLCPNIETLQYNTIDATDDHFETDKGADILQGIKFKRLKSIDIRDDFPSALLYIFKIIIACPNLEECMLSPFIYESYYDKTIEMEDADDRHNMNNLGYAKERIEALAQELKTKTLKRCLLGEDARKSHPIYKPLLSIFKTQSLSVISDLQQTNSELKHLQISHADSLLLAPDTALQSLSLVASDVVNAELLNHINCEQLESLSIEDICLNSEMLILFLNKLPNLKFLQLKSIKFKDNAEIKPALHLPHLISIIMDNCDFHKEWLAPLKGVQYIIVKNSPEIYLNQVKKLLSARNQLKQIVLPVDNSNNPSEEADALKALYPNIKIIFQATPSKSKPTIKTNAQQTLNEDQNAEFHPLEFFIPKAHAPLSTAEYRLHVHAKPARVDEKQQLFFSKFTNDFNELPEFRLSEIRYTNKNLRQQYELEFHQTPDIHYGKIPLILSSQEWTPLPSLSAQDRIQHIYLDTDFKLAYSKKLNLYAIKLAQGAKNNFNVEVILQARRYTSLLNHAELTPFEKHQDSFFKNLSFSLKNNKLSLKYKDAEPNLNSICTDIKDELLFDLDNSTLQYMLNNSTNPSSIVLQYLCIQSMRAFKREQLSKPTQDAVSLLNTLLEEQKGACRHRAYLFKAVFDCYRIPCRLITNDCHAFVEIKVSDTQWLSIDLGGYPGIIKNQSTYSNKRSSQQSYAQIRQLTYADGNTQYQPLAASASASSASAADNALTNADIYGSDSDDDDIFLDKSASSSTTAIIPRQKIIKQIPYDATHYDFTKNPFALWTTPQIEATDFDHFWQNLHREIQGLPPGTQNVLLSFKNAQDLQGFSESMLKKQSENQAACFYLASLDDINFHAAEIKHGNYSLAKSELVNYLENTQKQNNAMLVVRWSTKPQYIAYNTLIDTQKRRLGINDIAPTMTVILLIEEHETQHLREDFYSRIRIKKSVPQGIDCGPPLTLISDAVLDNAQIATLDLMGADDWKTQILGGIEMQGPQIIAQNGALSSAILQAKHGLCVRHAGEHLNNVEQLLKEIMIKRYFYFNGTRQPLPAHFTLSIAKSAHYDWTGRYSINLQNTEKTQSFDYVLNSETFSLYFKTYTYQGPNSTPQLSAQAGFIGPATTDKTLNILVTNTLDEGQWAKLIAHAKTYNTTLNFVIHQSTLPEALSQKITQQASTEASKPHEVVAMDIDDEKNESPAVAASASASSAAAAAAASSSITASPQANYYVHEDLDFLQDQVFTEHCLIINLNQDIGYELIERVNIDHAAASQGLSIQYSQGILAKALLAGKTVILKIYQGMLSQALEANLQSLFLAKPYLWLNGSKTPFTGKLVIISDNEDYFSLCEHKTMVKTDIQAQHLQLSSQFGAQKLKDLLEITQKIGLSLSYVELKTLLNRKQAITEDSLLPFILGKDKHTSLMQKCQNYFNQMPPKPVAMALDEAVASSGPALIQAHEFTQRAERIANFLAHDPCIFLIGPTGTGKSSIVLNNLPKFYQEQAGLTNAAVHLHVGMEKLLNWAKDKNGLALLFIDEANLLPEAAIETFESLYHPRPSIVIDGEYIELTAQHKVIFAGNTQDYTGRVQHAFSQRHGHYLALAPLSDATLIDAFIKPQLDAAYHNHLSLVSRVILDTYRFINQKPNSHLVLTPRNLKNISVRFNDLATVADHHCAIWLSCYDEIRYAVDKETKYEFKALMLKHIELPAYKTLKHMLKEQAAAIQFEQYASTHLNARRLIKQFIDKPNGPVGLILEGMPGLGKSTLAEHFLKNSSYQFLKSLSKNEAEAQLHECFHQGKTIIIDELNTLPYLEYSLNAFMMGQDLNGFAATTPGFKVIATQNPIHFAGRYALSPALENRFLKIKVKEYGKQELIAIAQIKGLPSPLGSQLAEDFLIAKQHAETHHLKPKPTARDYIHALSLFKPVQAPQAASTAAASAASTINSGDKRHSMFLQTLDTPERKHEESEHRAKKARAKSPVAQ